MSPRFVCILILALLILSNAKVAVSADLPPKDGGRLVKWSGQKYTSTKKIIFVHGCDMTPLSGGNWEKSETRFSTMIDGLNTLSKEQFQMPLSDFVEFWFYEYSSNQNINKLAGDLANLISNDPSFVDSEIAVIGYSQGGVVLWELMQGHPHLIEGGISIGGPINSTPIANKALRDKAVQELFPRLYKALIPLYDKLSKGTNQLDFHRELVAPLPSKLFLFAGFHKPPIYSGWFANFAVFVRIHTDLLDALAAVGGNFFTGMNAPRQFADVMSMIIYRAEWGEGREWDRYSDGLVPISSAFAGAISEDSQRKLFNSFNHFELLAGQGDFNVERALLDRLDQILYLTLHEEAIDLVLPELPDLSGIIRAESPLKRTRFAYVSMGRIHLADANWQRDYVVPVEGICSAPEFNSKKLGMTFTLNYKGNSNIFLFDEKIFRAVTKDNKSQRSSFSPNGGWLTYQSGDGLVVHNLKSGKSRIIVKGVDLVSSPIWVAEWLTGRVYFAHRNQESKIDIYCVSPRWKRARDIQELRPIIRDSGVPHVVRGYLGGVIATQSEWDSSGNLICQRMHFISGMLKNHYSLEIRMTSENSSITIDGNMFNKQILIETNQALRFESALLDKDYLQLYLVDKGESGSSSIYRFDYALMSSGESTTFEAVLSEVVSGGSQMDINILAD